MSKTKNRIRESNLRYRQSLGQHFLYDEALLEALAEAAEISPDEDVVEIGPGCGSLTRHLCSHAHRVLSIELDERLIPLLQAFMAGDQNFTLLQGDVMRLDLNRATEELRKPFVVAANIPYYITTPLIQRLLDPALPVSRMALMVQKEVAEKILSGPGEEGWGPLAVRCRYYCEAEKVMDVPAACFTPPPKVDSSFVLLRRRKEPAVPVRSEKDFFRIVGAAFALRRKTMLNNLCATFRLDRETAKAWMARAGLEERVRGEALTLGELAALADAMEPESAAGGEKGADE